MSEPIATPPAPVPPTAPAPAAPLASSVAPPAAPAAPAPPKADVSKSKAFIQRKAEELGMKAKLAELTPKIAELTPRAEKLAQLEKLAKEDPLKALELVGLDYQTVALAKAKKAGLSPEAAPAPDLKPIEERIAGVEKKLTDGEKQRQEAEAKAREQQIQSFVADVDTSIRAEAEKYPLLADLGKDPGAVGKLVFDKMLRHQKETGKVITAAEAAPLVEAEIAEQTAKFFEAHPALKAKVFPAPVEAAPEASREPPGGSKRKPPRPGTTPPPSVPVVMAKPEPAPAPKPPESRGPPSGVKKVPGETFAEFMARKEALQASRR